MYSYTLTYTHTHTHIYTYAYLCRKEMEAFRHILTYIHTYIRIPVQEGNGGFQVHTSTQEVDLECQE
jgi:hypothetical protein